MVFIASVGGGNECPITAKNLDAAEMDFVSPCGLTPERAATLRSELDRNKVVSVETSIDDAVAAKFQYTRSYPESHQRGLRLWLNLRRGGGLGRVGHHGV
jgi:hypothetical protein